MVDSRIIAGYLMYFVMPLWIAAGLADWMCHRHARIEHTSGTKESVLHVIMLAELGIPVVAVLFLEINALVIAVMIGAFFVHEATTWWDLHYAQTMRTISPIEQMVHSFLEIVPLLAGSLVILMHWSEFTSLIGWSSEAPDFAIRVKDPPLPIAYVVTILGAIVLLEWLPFTEELWRTLRAKPLPRTSQSMSTDK